MRYQTNNLIRTISVLKKIKPLILLGVFIILYSYCGITQVCPYNIDFEEGNFSGWTCYVGRTSAVGQQNEISLSSSSGPSWGHHTIFGENSTEVDPYGGFPVICPNGSGHSVRLGSTEAGGEAEGISYEFTIPANDNAYSLIYNYAVVFQSPNHQEYEQPRMEIEVLNVTDNITISCASFSFIALGSSLPGFQQSASTDTTVVLYKNWSAVSVDLSGNAGKTIRLFFKTADCTFRRHFGYAYIDVNSECGGNFLGATFCPDDKEINVVAPYGFQNYTWYDSSLTTLLGTQQLLKISPLPPSGTTLAVKLEPYPGFGCPKTLFTKLVDSLTVIANAGVDTLSCNSAQVHIGVRPKPGLIYSWSPAFGLTNPNIANPLASPATTTNYIVTTTNSGGGCRTTDTVLVKASFINDTLKLLGKAVFCLGNNDSAVLKVNPTSSIQWFKDEVPITGANLSQYKVTFSGSYYATLKNSDGCKINTLKQPITIDIAKPGIRYAEEYVLANSAFPLSARKIGESALWKPATYLDNANSFAPRFTGALEQLYTIDIKTATECLTVDTQLVKIIRSIEIYVPGAFTPNQDGKNDLLRPLLRGVKDLHYFRIFNRWGQLLYETKKPLEGWDGIFKGVPQETQTVVWMVRGTGIDGKIVSQKGTSVLLR